uniref:SFRICE_007436 n=1 Tax=Spodoptera frugiperda TaxID=7108 RepID=A0A2H1WET5_SPOFR
MATGVDNYYKNCVYFLIIGEGGRNTNNGFVGVYMSRAADNVTGYRGSGSKQEKKRDTLKDASIFERVLNMAESPAIVNAANGTARRYGEERPMSMFNYAQKLCSCALRCEGRIN